MTKRIVKKYAPEVRVRAVRIVLEHQGQFKATKTTISDKTTPCPLDKVNCQFRAPRPNALWVHYPPLPVERRMIHVGFQETIPTACMTEMRRLPPVCSVSAEPTDSCGMSAVHLFREDSGPDQPTFTRLRLLFRSISGWKCVAVPIRAVAVH